MAPIPQPSGDFASFALLARTVIDTIASAAPHNLLPRIDDTQQSSPQPHTANHIFRRQNQGPVDGIIPTYYQGLGTGPAPGAVVGIVLGSVAGFLLIVWLIQTVTQNSPGAIPAEEEIVIRRTDKSPRSRRSRHSHSTRNVEVRQVSRSPRRERIVVDDRRGPLPPPPRSPRRSRSIVVEERYEERRVPGDDIVEVIEEGTISDITPPPRRQRSNRDGRYR